MKYFEYQFLFRPVKKKVEIKRFQKADGVMGIFQTIKLMEQLKNKFKSLPEIRVLATNIIKKYNPQNLHEQVEAVYNWVRDNLKYVSDISGIETVQSPIITLKLGGGDCDDLSLVSATILESIGRDTQWIISGYSADKRFSHVYLLVNDGKRFLPFDITAKRVYGYERPEYTIKKLIIFSK